jgi:hypothetical protein
MEEHMRRNLSTAIVALAAAILSVPSPREAQGAHRGANHFTNLPVVNQDGKTPKFVIKGKIVLSSFAYTNCPDICPLVLGQRGEVTAPPKALPDKPEVTAVQSNPNESSADAVGLCLSMANVTFSRDPSKKRGVISRSFTCTEALARNLKLALDRETKETLEGLVRRYAPGGARAKTIEYACPQTDRCTVGITY